MGKLFGTDGIRGIANIDLTADLALKIGEASAHVLGGLGNITVVIGRDTRESGQMLLSALSAGLMSRGAKVIDLGIIPTPAVSYLIKKYGARMGVMISASHNPAEHNGIKLFNNEGFKLPDSVEEEIEKYLLGEQIPESRKIGSYEFAETAIDDYVNYLVNTKENIDTNLNLVVDCANGSASETAPLLFEKLGLNPTIINKDYNGLNINLNCGSTHLEGLIETVRQKGADAGIAYDGDADRCLMVDSEGNIIDGDFIMAITGLYYKQKGKLTNNTIVGTVMSNMGLKKFCEENEINFVATKVGDRYVLENMLQNNYIIGGEQSGHVIFKELSNTGDGELTSIQVLNILSSSHRPLGELASIMQEYPQVLINVKTTKEGKEQFKDNEEIKSLINEISTDLDKNGRVLIRPSGTEPLVRVMLEGLNVEDITEKANRIAELIKNKYGA